MKKIGMKRVILATLGCAILATAVGCNNSSSSTATPSATPTEEMEDTTAGTEDPYENLKMGLGIVVSSETNSLTDDTASASGTVSHTAITVLLEDDVICGSVLDEHEASISSASDGLTLPSEVQSKRELGDSYGMRSYSGIGKEWYEQADAFCVYIQGMTCEEVMAISVDEYGKATDADLAAGCTISITEFQQAVQKACDDAKNISDMDMNDYTNYKNESTGFWDDLMEGTEDVLEGVEDGVSDVVDGAENAVDDVTNGVTEGVNGVTENSYNA